MKIRQGFVSNSSSSSFLIAQLKKPKKCPTCGRCDPDIEELFDRGSSYDTSINYRGVERLLEEKKVGLKNEKDTLRDLERGYIAKSRWYKTKEDQICSLKQEIKILEDDIEMLKEWDEKYDNILYVTVGDHDTYVNEVLNQMVKNKEIVKRWSDEN